jgi:hypothetical protein
MTRMGSVVVACAMAVWACEPVAPPTLTVGELSATFGSETPTITIGARHVSIHARSIGRATQAALEVGRPIRAGEDVHTDRGHGVTEWWRTDRRGLEHGLTINERPSGEGELAIDLAVTGLTPRTVDETTIALGEVGYYSGLTVLDAAGSHVPASMHAIEHGIRIDVDDASARYPLVVDPLVMMQEQQLNPNNGPGQWAAVTAVAMSADGTRALVLGRCQTGCNDTAHIFARNGTTWTEETALVATSGGAYGALSADASIAVVGSGTTVAVYQRFGTSWSAANTITVASATPLAVSGDGSRLLAGTDVYVSTGGSWAHEATLAFTLGACANALGVGVPCPVSLSGDGSRAGLSTSANAAIFVRSGSSWTTETTLAAGNGITLTADGSRALVGGSVYARSGTSWSIEQSLGFATGTLSADGFVAFAATGGGCSTGVASWIRNGSTWTAGPTVSFACPTGVTSPVAASASGSRVIAAQSGFTTNSYVFHLTGLADGLGCTDPSDCANGNCVAGFCCASACSGSCQGCTVAQTGMPTGTCGALLPAIAPGVMCHAASGPCEMNSYCSPSSTACPTLYRVGTLCRAPAGFCDAPEYCDGTSNQCPLDGFQPSLLTCRFAAGPCDQSETCTGSSAQCPPDALMPSSQVCGTQFGPCDVAAHCSGTSPYCPPNSFLPAGTVCDTTPPSGPCDLPDVCTGGSAACPETYISGIVCRPAVGACDIAEVCLGSAPTCPADGVVGSGVVCRMSSDASCDPAEHCDGTTAMCPADVSTCVTRPDSGIGDAGTGDAGAHDAAVSDAAVSDATTHVDASTGTPPPMAASCGCRATRRTGFAWIVIALALLGERALRRRDRA